MFCPCLPGVGDFGMEVERQSINTTLSVFPWPESQGLGYRKMKIRSMCGGKVEGQGFGYPSRESTIDKVAAYATPPRFRV